MNNPHARYAKTKECRAAEAAYSAKALGFAEVADLYRQAETAYANRNYRKGDKLWQQAYALESPLMRITLGENNQLGWGQQK